MRNVSRLTSRRAPVPLQPASLPTAGMPRRRWSVLGLAMVIGLNGCANFQRPLAVPQAAILNAPETRTVDDNGSNATVDIDAGFVADDLFMLKPITTGSPLPPMSVSGLSVTESGVYDALRLVLKDTGITLNIEGGSRGGERFGPVSAFDVKGSLAEVLDTLSETIGFFYSFRKNTLFIQQEQQFIVELPPALSEDNAAGLTNTLQFLGARDPYIDRLNRSLVFRTNRPSLAKIEGYLQRVRETRSLIIYDVNIFQVDLRDNNDTGIQWNKLGWAGTPGVATGAGAPVSPLPTLGGGGGVAPAAAAPAVGNAVAAGLTSLGLGLVLSSSRFSIDMLINFLQTQGNVKAISRPRLAVLSGTKGSLRVGQSTTYVSKVGTNFSTSVNQVTTETRDLKTGLDLTLFGDFSDNTIYTRIGLAISEIVSLNKFTALGTDLTLPTTADREINTVIRARPGDMILLGGITINRDSTDLRRGITQNGTADSVTRSELVLAMKAKVVAFQSKAKMMARQDALAPFVPASVPATPPVPASPVQPIAPTPATTAPRGRVAAVTVLLPATAGFAQPLVSPFASDPEVTTYVVRMPVSNPDVDLAAALLAPASSAGPEMAAVEIASQSTAVRPMLVLNDAPAESPEPLVLRASWTIGGVAIPFGLQDEKLRNLASIYYGTAPSAEE